MAWLTLKGLKLIEPLFFYLLIRNRCLSGGHEKNEIERLENSRMEQPGLKHRHHLLSSNALPGQTLDQCL